MHLLTYLNTNAVVVFRLTSIKEEETNITLETPSQGSDRCLKVINCKPGTVGLYTSDQHIKLQINQSELSELICAQTNHNIVVVTEYTIHIRAL